MHVTKLGDRFILHREHTYPLYYSSLEDLNTAVSGGSAQLELFKLEEIIYVKEG